MITKAFAQIGVWLVVVLLEIADCATMRDDLDDMIWNAGFHFAYAYLFIVRIALFFVAVLGGAWISITIGEE